MISLIIPTIVSLLIIYLFHSGWNYLKDTYTTRKTKDLVNSQIEKYKKIVSGKLEEKKQDFLNEEEKKRMNVELNEFLLSIQ